MARIIIVDEDAALLALVGEALQDLGHEVMVSANFRQAMFLYLLWQPVDVIMSDIFISDIHGLRLMARIIRHGQQRLAEPDKATMDMSRYHIICNSHVSLHACQQLNARMIQATPSHQHALRHELAKMLASAGNGMDQRCGASGLGQTARSHP